MDTSKKIADKAHNLFIRYGIRSTSMDDIASDLGISKKTVYQFYSNKDSLVEGLVDKATEEHIGRCNHLISKRSDAIIELYFLLVYIHELYDILTPAIIYDLEKNHELAYEKFKDHKALFVYQTLKTNIERGIKMGLYRNDFDIDIISKFFLESLSLISNPGVFAQTHHSGIKLTDELFACLISGIVTATGMEVVSAYKNQGSIMLLGNNKDRPFWDH
ncbi:TetR/AcrR family transcriptional regulator [Mucilaginibacter sp. ZT4R22]|uniref:TetR/AcrR family transcriptional regulator n=1 Tax=Mucilaginibacter pankratovii TaxID=2772110 RepID=A0ABR7WVV2_9SPHI|nr:TetR/AcrR family transcriptional regulator [Mucilaginibacter pankratovii]MBD1365402.1 TetR/AcrR family transcriptional regulator [Mucilaginibacter pankratovii]